MVNIADSRAALTLGPARECGADHTSPKPPLGPHESMTGVRIKHLQCLTAAVIVGFLCDSSETSLTNIERPFASPD